MRLSSIALLAGATAVAADSTVTLFLPGFDAQSIEGKVIGSKGSVTSYVLNCPAGADPNDCGLPQSGYTVIEGPSTLQMEYSDGDTTIKQACDLMGTTRAACSASFAANGMTSHITETVQIATIPYGGYQAVHITATQTGASATTGDSASVSTATSTGSKSGSDSSSTTTNTAASAGAEKTQSTSTNAALPAVTGNAQWAIGGVAAALALAVV